MDYQCFFSDYDSFDKIEPELKLGYPSAPSSVSSTVSRSASDDLETISEGSDRTSELKEDQALQKRTTKAQEIGTTGKRNSGSKPKKTFACQYCQKVFNRPSALQTHTYTHTAEKPFQCLSPNCGRSFSVVSNLRRHFKVHQKASGSNKLSSEDRFRCVQRLMQKTDAIIRLQKRLVANNNDYELPFSHVERQNIAQQHQSTTVNHYRHNFILPAINGFTHENQYYGTVHPLLQKSVAQTPTQPTPGGRMLINNTLLHVPQAWSDNHFVPGTHINGGSSTKRNDTSYNNTLTPFTTFGLSEDNQHLHFSDNISNNNSNYTFQNGLRSL